MEKTQDFELLLSDLFTGQLLACSLSKLRKKEGSSYKKVSLRPIKLKGTLHYQVTYHYPNKETHENLTPQKAEQLVFELMTDTFRQGHFLTPHADWQVLVSKKGAMTILKHPPSRQKGEVTLTHDRSKKYLLQEGTPYPFLVELGVMNRSGKVLAKRYHKFRQLNKYLEIVESCLPHLQPRQGKPLTIVDFGSGKAYLTFALYHYLVEQLQMNVEVIGLDLKADVVSFCNQMASKLGYSHLRFFQQDIRDFQAQGQVDLVVSLHACDVATDYALAQAVKWQAQVVLAVPCCQHEVFRQLDENIQPVLLEHGILKERVSALLTDAARAKLMETQGYAVRIMEFIDLEHTPKNLLIRAFRHSEPSVEKAKAEYESFRQYWKIKPTLEKLLAKNDSPGQT